MAELLAGLGSQLIFIPRPSEDAMRVTTFTKSNDLRSPRSPRSPRPMTPLFTNDTVADKSRRQIDLEVLRLEDHIRTLKSQRNSLAPVATLPPEMLAKIFAYRVTEDAATNYPLNWIKVTQVSRYWRSVALDTPSLWTNITFTHPRWAEEMLKRSKSAGLTVKAGIGMSTPRMRNIVEQALRQATRIHHLDLHGGHGVVERVLTDLDFEAPMLRSLVLSGPTGHYHSLYDSDNIVVPEKMMLCEMPYLRRVELRRCKVNWEAQNLANLHELQLQNLPEISRPSMEQLVGMLSRMPGLQVLDLTDALPAVASASTSTEIDDIIRLPALTRLVLTGRAHACVDLIRRISIPHQATLRINCTAASPAETEFTGLIQFVTKLQNAKGAKPLRSLHIHHMGYSNLQLRAWSKVIPSSNCLSPSTPEIEILMNWSGASGQNLQNDILRTFVSSVPLGQLQALNMYSMYTQMPPELWRDGFGLLPKLQHVTIRGASALTFTTAMTQERTETLSPTSPTIRRSSDLLTVRRPGLRRRRSAVLPVYFPALQKLELEDVDFEDYIDEQEFLDAFMDALMERCERKAEIQHLVLTSCMHLDVDEVELLEQIVVDVTWDGCVQGYTDEEEDEDDYSDDYWGQDPYDDYYEDYSDDYGGMFF